MSLTIRVFIALAAGVCIAPPASAQSRPPVRQLGAVIARSTEPLGSVMSVRHLPGGRVLVNDAVSRRVVLLDSALATSTVVADTTSATGHAYGARLAGLIPYRGDSTLFVDPASMSMLVLDPAGKVGRVMSVPRSQDAGALAGPLGGNAGFDAQGRLVYRSMPQFRMMGGPAGGPPQMAPMPDSAAIVRVDLATRTVDTVGFVKVPRPNMQASRGENGRMTFTTEINPLPIVDEWAVLADGSVAIVRGRDYHVDLVRGDGTRQAAPKIPFDWQRLSDEDKAAFIDSVKAARARLLASAPAGGGAAGGAGAGDPGVPLVVTTIIGGGGGGGGGGAAAGGGAGRGGNVEFVSPSELPDYKPAFFAGAVRADADGHLWIRTIPTQRLEGGPVYDVVNSQGVLVDRVQVPAGRTVVGFGSGGVVYLVAREPGVATVHLERAHIR